MESIQILCLENQASIGASPENAAKDHLMSSSESPVRNVRNPQVEAQTDYQRRTAEQACKECRRRKAKCDRVIPICVLCDKFDRTCIYEKQTRTPLTRRYLTEVEDELARTKALLQQFMPDTDTTDQVNFGHPIELANSSRRSESFSQAQSLSENADLQHKNHGQPGVAGPTVTPNLRPQHYPSNPGTTPNNIPYPPIQVQSPGTLDRRSIGQSAIALETPPSSNNFEWDERTGKASGDKFVDGMASLTSDANESGYLGVASGAALLRITDTNSTHARDIHVSNSDIGMAAYHSRSIPFALTSLGQLEPFVEAYFSLYHRSYPIVHEATFRAEFSEIIPRPSGNAWQVLLFVLAAVGAFTSSTQQSEIDQGLFEAAKARLSIDMLETGNLLLVQILTLISNYMQKRNKPNSGYNYMGLARRIAMGVGLHKEFPSWEASIFTTEMRRRIWYCLYIFDVGAIITFSRPLDFPNDGIDVKLPLNVHDSDITAGTKRLPEQCDETTVYTHLRSQASFHLLTSGIYSKIISSPFPSASELIDLDDQMIGSWLATLPRCFQEHVIQPEKFQLCHSILRWRYRNFRILMYRPFLVGRLITRLGRGTAENQDNDAHTEIAIRRCLDAARESVELISDYWAQPKRQNMMACWYGLYFLFQAILIPVICLRNDPQNTEAASWRDQIEQAMVVLESMVHLNPTSNRCLGVIRSLCGTYLNSSFDLGQPTEESPQTQLANLYPLMWPTLDTMQPEGMDSILQESTIMDFMNQLQ